MSVLKLNIYREKARKHQETKCWYLQIKKEAEPGTRQEAANKENEEDQLPLQTNPSLHPYLSPVPWSLRGSNKMHLSERSRNSQFVVGRLHSCKCLRWKGAQWAGPPAWAAGASGRGPWTRSWVGVWCVRLGAVRRRRWRWGVDGCCPHCRSSCPQARPNLVSCCGYRTRSGGELGINHMTSRSPSWFDAKRVAQLLIYFLHVGQMTKWYHVCLETAAWELSYRQEMMGVGKPALLRGEFTNQQLEISD